MSEAAESARADPAGDDVTARQTTHIIAALIICASAVMVMWNLQTRSKKNSNTGSRYATIESLVDNGTFAIDKSTYKFTIDKVKVGKHYYSSKPPTLPTYGAALYWVYQKFTGKKIATDEGAVLWFVGIGTGWLTHVVLLIYFYRLGRLLFTRQLAQLGSLASMAFGCLSVAFATTINNHSFSACLVFACFFHCVAIRLGHRQWWHWIAAGAFGGFLPAIDLPSTLVTACVFSLLFLQDRRKALVYFLPATLPGIGCSLLLSYASTGSVVPVYLRPELYKYPGSYWNARQGIDKLREPKHIYAFHMLFGHHGLFSMTPLFCFSLVAVWQTMRARGRLWLESLSVLLICVVTVLFYVFRSRNYGGWSVGMRWLVPIMPLLMFYFGVWLDRVELSPGFAYGRRGLRRLAKSWARGRWALVVLAFFVGGYHVQDGLTSPFQYSRWHNWLDGKPNRNRQAAKLNLGKAERAAQKKAKRRRRKVTKQTKEKASKKQ